MELNHSNAMQLVSVDFGPVGDADVTANLTEAVPCGPALHSPAELPEDTVELPFLHIKVPHHPGDSTHLLQVRQSQLTIITWWTGCSRHLGGE